MNITFGSVCSGIEAASVAWNPLGWEASWLAEIEPFPSEVLKHHYPDTLNLGDMTKIADKILSKKTPAPDVLVGGTPCQAFSVAGMREGLSDPRGELTIRYVELADAIDNIRQQRGEQPAIIVWENVPGVLSSKDNAFGCFLGALAGEDCELQPAGKRWTNAGCVHGPQRTVAWRVLDAQYFGLAQRRKRVFVVASARKRFDPAKVLFEFDGVRRDIAPSREQRQETAKDVATSSGTANPVVGALCARDFKGVGNQYVTEGKLIIEGDVFGKAGQLENNVNAFGEYADDDSASTMKARDYKDATDLVAYSFDSLSSNSMKSSNPHSGCREVILSKTLDTTIPCPSKNQGGICVVEQAFGIPGNWIGRKPENGGNSTQFMHEVAPAQTVRRLTPIECERLQGFPDGYTAIPWRGKSAEECPDGHRYKALGNSMAVPVMRWIGERIIKHLMQ